MTNVQARLIAASLALVAGAILFVASPDQVLIKDGFLFVAIVLFIVEYVRIQLPPPGQPATPA